MFEFINELKAAIIIGYQPEIVQQLSAERCKENDGASEPLKAITRSEVTTVIK